jgi:hypothetical protein
VQHLIEAVRSAVKEKNWYAALGLALTLPDICGKLESPTAKSQARYIAWCNSYLVPRYTHEIGASREEHVFLHGEDCYALRCAVLHEGVDDIVNQWARKALESFIIIAGPNGITIHCNQSDAKLQLQVDLFCEDICLGVTEWIAKVPDIDPDVQARVDGLMKVMNTDGSFAF